MWNVNYKVHREDSLVFFSSNVVVDFDSDAKTEPLSRWNSEA